jgi:hypothetical protein
LKRSVYPRSKLKPDALVDYSGDNLAQVYLKGPSQWTHRHNFYELTHFLNDNGNELNFPKDLLDFQLENLMTRDKGLAKRIRKITDQHPTELFAMALPDPQAKRFAEALTSDHPAHFSLRDPILIVGKNSRTENLRFGLILTRSDLIGNDQFCYRVFENFEQTQEGQYRAKLSTDPEDDPLEYLEVVAEAHELAQWKSDREWIQWTRLHPKPTALFALPRMLTLAPRFTDHRVTEVSPAIKALRDSETPDFVLIASPGYAYHSNAPMESDHGGLAREEVRNSFFVSSLDSSHFVEHEEILDFPILTRDFMPTVLEYAGLGEAGNDPLPLTQGLSFKPILEKERLVLNEEPFEKMLLIE